MAKPTSHPKLASSSSTSSSTNPHSSSRHRSDRTDRSISATERVSFPGVVRSSSSSGAMPSAQRVNSSSSNNNLNAVPGSGGQQQRSSSHSSHDSANYSRSDPNKVRNNTMPHPHSSVAGQSSHQRNNSSSASSSSVNKLDQRHPQSREQKMSGNEAAHKSMSKSAQGQQQPSSQNSNVMYPAVNSSELNRNTSTRHPQALAHSQTTKYNSHTPGKLPELSKMGRTSHNLSSADQTSVQSQQQLPPPPTKRPSTIDSSSFRLTDDLTNIKSLDNLDLLSTSPPRQLLSTQNAKAPSIFSPEWNEKPAGSNGNGDEISSPIKQEQKPLISSDLIGKMDNRAEHYTMSGSQMGHAKSIAGVGEKRPSSSNSKRYNESMGMPVNQQASMFDNRSEIKSSSKRNFGNMEFGQSDAIDAKEYKIRKIEPTQSPPSTSMSQSFGASASNTNSSSGFDDMLPSKSYNGIETNPHIVSNILKESLFSENSNKFGVPSMSMPSTGIDEFELNASQFMQYQQVQQPHAQQPHAQQQQTLPQQPQQSNSNHNAEILYDRAENIYDRTMFLNSSNKQQQQQLQQLPQQQQLQQQQPQQQPQHPSQYMQRPVKTDNFNSIDDVGLGTFDAQFQQNNAFYAQTQNISTNPQKMLPAQIQLNPEDPDSESVHSKSEKKKKKEKHKNKDKEKSKDREERKKHKKDKDRHRDKDRSDEAKELKPEPIILKIQKQQLNEPVKLIINKDSIKNYDSTQGTSSHSKKKDKNRDRDKDKVVKAIPNAPNKVILANNYA